MRCRLIGWVSGWLFSSYWLSQHASGSTAVIPGAMWNHGATWPRRRARETSSIRRFVGVAASSGETGLDGLNSVPGLTRVLGAAQLLDSHGIAVSAWCDEMGAASLEEVLDAVEDLASDVSLSSRETAALKNVINGALEDSSSALKSFYRKAQQAVEKIESRDDEVEGPTTKAGPGGNPTPSKKQERGSNGSVPFPYTVLESGVVVRGREGPVTVPPASLCLASLTRAANVGDKEEARRWFAAFEEADKEPRLMLITAAGMAHDSDAAERCYAALVERDGKPTDGAMGALIGAHARAGHLCRAKERFHEFLDSGYRMNMEAYNALIGGYAAEGNVREAEDCFDKMRASGLRPTLKQYTHLVQCYVVAEPLPLVDQAEEAALLRMLAEGISPEDPALASLTGALGSKRFSTFFAEFIRPVA